ncbi:hypothetical protein D3C73_1526870 [compost metagenome]
MVADDVGQTRRFGEGNHGLLFFGTAIGRGSDPGLEGFDLFRLGRILTLDQLFAEHDEGFDRVRRFFAFGRGED